MVVPAVGEVVLVPFPFSDLSPTKVRPALCLADSGRGDWILCQITSSPYGDPKAVRLRKADFGSGGLRITSYARPGKLFTANTALLVRSLVKLKTSSRQRVLDAVIAILRPGSP